MLLGTEVATTSPAPASGSQCACGSVRGVHVSMFRRTTLCVCVKACKRCLHTDFSAAASVAGMSDTYARDKHLENLDVVAGRANGPGGLSRPHGRMSHNGVWWLPPLWRVASATLDMCVVRRLGRWKVAVYIRIETEWEGFLWNWIDHQCVAGWRWRAKVCGESVIWVSEQTISETIIILHEYPSNYTLCPHTTHMNSYHVFCRGQQYTSLLNSTSLYMYANFRPSRYHLCYIILYSAVSTKTTFLLAQIRDQ